jgi:hypothetical protein
MEIPKSGDKVKQSVFLEVPLNIDFVAKINPHN